MKVFLRDVSQWSQLLLLLALVLVYLYNFRVLDLERVPYMSGIVKNVYALINLGMAGFVMATIAVRFVFPAVSAEGAAFWIVRTAPISLRDFLWSKFWTGLVPVLVLTETLTVLANQFLGIDPFLKVASAVAILFMSLALVGLATGLGARYPRFNAENPTDVAGSVRRRDVHDPRRPLRHHRLRAGRLAVVAVPLASRARRASVRPPAVGGVALVRSRSRVQPSDVVVVDAFRCASVGRDGVRRGRVDDQIASTSPYHSGVSWARAAPQIHVPSPIRFSQTSLALTDSCAVGSLMLSEAGSARFQLAIHLEPQPAVTHVHDARRGIVDADGQAANHGLPFPAARRAESRAGRRELLRNEIEQTCRRHRLEDVVCAAAMRIGLENGIRETGDDDGRDGLRSADDELQPVVGTQPHVGDQQIGRRGPEDAGGVLERPDGDGLVPGFLEEFGEAFPRCLVVVDDQHLRRHALLSGSACG